jgi:hypothetical protein
VTVALKRGDVQVLFAVPGAIRVDDKGTRSVQPFVCRLWTDWGINIAARIQIDISIGLRLAYRPEQAEVLVNTSKVAMNSHPGITVDQLTTHSCETLYDEDKNFEKALKNTTNKYSELGLGVYPRGAYLQKVMAPLLRLTPDEWTMQAPDGALKTELEEGLAATLGDITSAMTDEKRVALFTTEMGQKPANVKYLIKMLDLAAAHCIGEVEPLLGSQGPAGPTPQLTVAVDGLKASVAKIAQDTKEGIKKLTDLVSQMGTQMNLRSAVSDAALSASFIKVEANHNCGYTALQALADRANNPDSTLAMGPAKVKTAKAAIICEARKAWLVDPEKFKMATSEDSFEAYCNRLTSLPSTLNWKGSPEGLYFVAAPENRDLEVRTLYKDPEGRVQVESTLHDGEPPRRHVGFCLLSEGHYNIGSMSAHGEAAGNCKFIFSTEEAPRAQRLLMEMLAGGQRQTKTKAVTFAPPDVSQTDAEFKASIIKFMNDDAKSDGVPWQVVASKDKANKKAEADKRKEQELTVQRAKQHEELQRQAAATLAKQQQDLTKATQQLIQQQRAQQPGHRQQQPAWNWPSSGQPTWPPNQHQLQQSAWSQPQQQQQLPQPGGWVQSQQPGWWGTAAVPQQKPVATGWGTAQQQPAWGRSKGPSVGGEPVVPAVVVFGDGTKEALRKFLATLEPTAASAVISIQQVTGKMGSARCVLHCKQSTTLLVQSLIPLLVAKNQRAAVYAPHFAAGQQQLASGVVPKAQRAQAGLANAAGKAGVCRYFAQGVECPHFSLNGRCKFVCYCGPPP